MKKVTSKKINNKTSRNPLLRRIKTFKSESANALNVQLLVLISYNTGIGGPWPKILGGGGTSHKRRIKFF